jgi:hypothetical protein
LILRRSEKYGGRLDRSAMLLIVALDFIRIVDEL